MRIRFVCPLIAALAVFSCGGTAFGQWDWNKVRARGMFGDRSLGETIQPQPSTRFNNSYWRGPGGSFLGRDATRPGMMFPSPYAKNEYAPPRIEEISPAVLSRGLSYSEEALQRPDVAAPEARPLGPRRVGPPGMEAEAGQEAPEIWFRGSPPPGGSAASAAASQPPPPPPPPGVVLSGVGPTLGQTLGTPGGMASGLGAAGSLDELMSRSLQAQIARVPRFQAGGPIQVSVSAGVATLQGSVTSQHDRKVLGEFIRMEPGVWDVNNQLTVEP